jgi:hypothetical protein
MARWKLTAKHYLNVPGTFWRHEETSRDTGERIEQMYPVPKHLDPDDPRQQNRQGEVIVCLEGKGERGDIIFTGKPTPDMEPIDDEAEAITAIERPKWQDPIETLPMNGDFSQSLFTMLQNKLDAAATAQSLPSVDPAAFVLMQEQLATLMDRNAELEANAAGAPKTTRRM